jgi:hypothetical protein
MTIIAPHSKNLSRRAIYGDLVEPLRSRGFVPYTFHVVPRWQGATARRSGAAARIESLGVLEVAASNA